MAAATVFSLPELLENIVLCLPLRSVIIAKQVNKAFCDTINNSIWVRRALFLEPSCESRVSWHRATDSDYIGDGQWKDQNQLKKTLIVNPFMAITDEDPFEDLYCNQWYRSQLNGVYLRLNEVFALAPAESAHRVLHFESDYEDKSDLLSRLQTSRAGFKRMHVTHPPISSLTIDDGIIRPRVGGRFTMDDLLDSTLALSGVDENENDFEIEGGQDFRVLARSTDEITGWEMLRIFELNEAQLDEEELLVVELVDEIDIKCQAITVDLKTGKKAEGEEGEAWKRLNKDRRVDKGWKYRSVFGMYSYTSLKDIGQTIKVGDTAVVTKRVKEQPVFDWPLPKAVIAAFSG